MDEPLVAMSQVEGSGARRITLDEFEALRPRCQEHTEHTIREYVGQVTSTTSQMQPDVRCSPQRRGAEKSRGGRGIFSLTEGVLPPYLLKTPSGGSIDATFWPMEWRP